MSVRISVLALALLAGCGPLVQIGGNAPAPDALFTLRAQTEPPAQRAEAPSSTVLVEVPAVPGALQTLRVPVITADTQVAYLVGATWVEQPNRLFARLLADVVNSKPGVAALSPQQGAVRFDRRLTGELQEFGLDVRDPASPRVRVRLDATLAGRNGQVVAIRRFDEVVPAPTQAPSDVAAAMNLAANRVAEQVATWVRAS